MRTRISLIVIAMVLYGCQQITPIERFQDEVPITESINTDTKCYYWCDDVKIPLNVNDSVPDAKSRSLITVYASFCRFSL